MKRYSMALAVLVGISGAANAASIQVEADAPTYTVGETVTLTVTGTIPPGDPATLPGSDNYSAFARLDYAASLTDPDPTSGSQIPITYTNGMKSFVLGGAIGPVEDGGSFLLSQISEDGSLGPPRSVDPQVVIGTTRLIAEAEGTVVVSFFVDSTSTQTLDFFGVTSAPGTSFRILIPEPGTAVLFALGVLGLAAAGRVRGRS